MKLLISYIFLSLLTVGCTTGISKNMVQRGTFDLAGGVKGEKTWEDLLSFERVSLYQELNLLFDLMVAKVDKNTPFYEWLSSDEKEEAQSCGHFYVALSYHLDGNRISQGTFEDALVTQGFKQVHLTGFKSNLVLHPDYTMNHFKVYKVYGICGDKENMDLEFPGFTKLSFPN